MTKPLLTIFFILLALFSLSQASINPQSSDLQNATVGGGCFWCTEAIFERIPGVVNVESGYSGGHIPNPTYQQVKSGQTGYAEVIRITYDPKNVTYADILDAFFHSHDPTLLNRQGIDVGHQYRSVIFYHDEGQRYTAERTIKLLELRGEFKDPIVTEVAPLINYYTAEDYHQDYYSTFQENQFCTVDTADITQKIDKFFVKFNQSSNEEKKAEISEKDLKLASPNSKVANKINPIKVIKSLNPFHPWHNINFGPKAPEVVQAFIEIQKGSRAKHEVDKATGYLALDRVIHESYPYPINYGFIPQTLYGDGDGLDILVISSIDLKPETLVQARVIGVMSMVDNNEVDDKIVAVVHKDMELSHIKDISDLKPIVMEEIVNYFENYKKPENGTVVVKGVSGKDVAYKAIKEGIKLYRDIYVFGNEL